MKKSTPKNVESFELREVKRLNDWLDRSYNLSAVSDRIYWLYRFRKLPAPILDALITKTTAIFKGSWYGDEPAETVIKTYIGGVL